jgi:hypothetical protein
MSTPVVLGGDGNPGAEVAGFEGTTGGLLLICVAALRARSASWSFTKQQRLYFLPLPQGQGSLRPILTLATVTKLVVV